MSIEEKLLLEMLAVLPGVASAQLRSETVGGLPSVFPVSELATTAVSAAALAAARFAASPAVTVNRRLASAWFAKSIYPEGWAIPPAWDPLAGDYRTSDGWIRLHTNAAHHREAALAVLGSGDTPGAVTEVVSTWSGHELESAIVDAGGCAAVMHTTEEWFTSAQGTAVAAEPLIAWRDLGSHKKPSVAAPSDRPLANVRVLDLTRILAGPVATRFLALLGADVLRVDPPGWEETLIPEVTLGKHTTRLDLTRTSDRSAFSELVAAADVVVHGYRPDALERLGFGQDHLQAIRPGIIDVSLNAYGWTGPLSARRGFDSLVQMTTGIAHSGMIHTNASRPVPLPVQALDQATGYLLAAATLSALVHRRETGIARSAKLSLARTAILLQQQDQGFHDPFPDIGRDDFEPRLEATSWGPAHRLRQPVHIDGISLYASPARSLGLDEPHWRST